MEMLAIFFYMGNDLTAWTYPILIVTVVSLPRNCLIWSYEFVNVHACCR